MEKADTGEEGFTLETIEVEVLGVAVGGCYKHDTVGHQGFEKAVGHVSEEVVCSGSMPHRRKIIASATSVH